MDSGDAPDAKFIDPLTTIGDMQSGNGQVMGTTNHPHAYSIDTKSEETWLIQGDGELEINMNRVK
jgi:hypothetical protein